MSSLQVLQYERNPDEPPGYGDIADHICNELRYIVISYKYSFQPTAFALLHVDSPLTKGCVAIIRFQKNLIFINVLQILVEALVIVIVFITISASFHQTSGCYCHFARLHQLFY
jgi:hypothetical protein